MHGKKLKIILSLVVIAVLALASAWVVNYYNNDSSQNNTQSTQQTSTTNSVTINEDGKIVKYDGIDGQTALNLLNQYTTVETKEYPGLGEYVVSINGLASDTTSNYWAFYINNESSQVGAGDYITKLGDKIEWRLEDVSTFEQ
ncbi:MAG: DUF4430 domain-containing protein [Patescibacteria group bacterium]|jgi:hypothetical protein|nr:DUF4430 domain-containing protein [Patescibacteria group bacterium]